MAIDDCACAAHHWREHQDLGGTRARCATGHHTGAPSALDPLLLFLCESARATPQSQARLMDGYATLGFQVAASPFDLPENETIVAFADQVHACTDCDMLRVVIQWKHLNVPACRRSTLSSKRCMSTPYLGSGLKWPGHLDSIGRIWQRTTQPGMMCAQCWQQCAEARPSPITCHIGSLRKYRGR